MYDRPKVSDFFLGILGAGLIGLLIAVMLFSVLTLSGQNELAFVDANPPVMPPLTN